MRGIVGFLNSEYVLNGIKYFIISYIISKKVDTYIHPNLSSNNLNVNGWKENHKLVIMYIIIMNYSIRFQRKAIFKHFIIRCHGNQSRFTWVIEA